LQRLCKTSIKKNLYFEIKEKVIEESYNGVRVDRKKARVKEYGLNTNKETRARLIELLHERVKYHKDKFISPLLHHELETLEVDNKGKTQAIYPNHDDQVFSYLMALYVWYDGKDLAENFGIQKNVLKTDEDVEIVDGDIEYNEQTAKIPIEDVDEIENEEVQSQLKYIKDASKYRLQRDYESELYEKEQEEFNQYIQFNRDAKEAYEKKYHIQPVENQMVNGIQYIRIPDSVFGNLSDDDIDLEKQKELELHGNLYDMFTGL
jgi:hypothetical protein